MYKTKMNRLKRTENRKQIIQVNGIAPNMFHIRITFCYRRKNEKIFNEQGKKNRSNEIQMFTYPVRHTRRQNASVFFFFIPIRQISWIVSKI